MRVITSDHEYTLYIGSDGVWTMHVWNPAAERGFQWVGSYIDVSSANPFVTVPSTVTYDAWR